jgi:hypothetical protein
MKSIVALALTVIGSGAGCATHSAAPPPTLATDTEPPAYLVGPGARLAADGDRVVGRVNGGFYDMRIAADAVAGRGPLGVIDLRLSQRRSGYLANGLWNGQKVSFAVSKDAVRGDAFHALSSQMRNPIECRYDIEKLHGRASYQVYQQCIGLEDRPLRLDLQGQPAAGLEDPHTAMMVIAYVLAPDAVRDQ